jgi:PKHD-type hydroxylase
MLLPITGILGPDEAAAMRAELERAEWSDGRGTAGYLSRAVKKNAQLREDHPVAQRLGQKVMDALDRSELFLSAALPLKVVPPLFNRYEQGQTYGRHVDGAIRPVPGWPQRVRTDLSATLFLSAPADYDGGELVIADVAGARAFKLEAGDLLLYPADRVHHVAPVSRGTRLASFFWVQSIVRSQEQRAILFQLDNGLRTLARDVPDHPSLVEMMAVYHNLLRQWGDT